MALSMLNLSPMRNKAQKHLPNYRQRLTTSGICEDNYEHRTYRQGY